MMQLRMTCVMLSVAVSMSAVVMRMYCKLKPNGLVIVLRCTYMHVAWCKESSTMMQGSYRL